MKRDLAMAALHAMKVDLDKGRSWKPAYSKHADLNPDLKDRAANPKSIRILICYLFDSTVSADGFDFETFQIAENLPKEHLRELVQAGRGTQVYRGSDGRRLFVSGCAALSAKRTLKLTALTITGPTYGHC